MSKDTPRRSAAAAMAWAMRKVAPNRYVTAAAFEPYSLKLPCELGISCPGCLYFQQGHPDCAETELQFLNEIEAARQQICKDISGLHDLFNAKEPELPAQD